MIVDPKEAADYKCCAMPKQCQGPECMAWRVHFVRIASPVPAGARVPYMPSTPVDSGKGYCGLLRGGE